MSGGWHRHPVKEIKYQPGQHLFRVEQHQETAKYLVREYELVRDTKHYIVFTPIGAKREVEYKRLKTEWEGYSSPAEAITRLIDKKSTEHEITTKKLEWLEDDIMELQTLLGEYKETS